MNAIHFLLCRNGNFSYLILAASYSHFYRNTQSVWSCFYRRLLFFRNWNSLPQTILSALLAFCWILAIVFTFDKKKIFIFFFVHFSIFFVYFFLFTFRCFCWKKKLFSFFSAHLIQFKLFVKEFEYFFFSCNFSSTWESDFIQLKKKRFENAFLKRFTVQLPH